MPRSRVAPVIVVLMLAGARLYDEADATARQSLSAHYTPADRNAHRYQYVPFEVLPGTEWLQLEYEYDKENGGNAVGLGLFEPGSLELGTAAFRGYSGSAKTSIAIAAHDATPGYRAGRLPPGRWHVLLDLTRVHDAGVDVSITIETRAAVTRAAPAAPDASASARPSVQGELPPAEAAVGREGGPDASGAWLLGALHTHTVHSTGTLTPPALMQQFAAAGFDFVAITDDNNTTHRRDLQNHPATRPLLISGEEVATAHGHAGVWGLDDGEWVDFRAVSGGIADLVSATRRFGAVFAINHPAAACAGCAWEHAIPDEVAAIEVWTGGASDSAAMTRWDALLAAGRQMTGVGSTDWRSPATPIDGPHVRVQAPRLTESAILTAIQSGRVIIMNGAGRKTPEITVRAGARTAPIGGVLRVSGPTVVSVELVASDLPRGRLTTVVNGKRSAERILDESGRIGFDERAAIGYLRFELRAADGTLVALTNPVYLRN
jgi:hypothetical protein